MSNHHGNNIVMHFAKLRLFRARSISRFAIVGGINTAMGIGTFPVLYWLLAQWLGVNALLVLSWLLTTASAFLLHKFVTFESRGAYRYEGFKFLILSLITLGINIIVMHLGLSFTSFDPVVIQVIIATVLSLMLALLSYFGMNYFIFIAPVKK